MNNHNYHADYKFVVPNMNLRSSVGRAEAIDWIDAHGGDTDGDVTDASGIRMALATVPGATKTESGEAQS